MHINTYNDCMSYKSIYTQIWKIQQENYSEEMTKRIQEMNNDYKEMISETHWWLVWMR